MQQVEHLFQIMEEDSKYETRAVVIYIDGQPDLIEGTIDRTITYGKVTSWLLLNSHSKRAFTDVHSSKGINDRPNGQPHSRRSDLQASDYGKFCHLRKWLMIKSSSKRSFSELPWQIPVLERQPIRDVASSSTSQLASSLFGFSFGKYIQTFNLLSRRNLKAKCGI